MKKKFLIPIMLLITTSIFSQGIYNNGGNIVVGSGAFMIVSGPNGNYRNETNITNGTIELKGTFKIEGNYTNNVSGADIMNPSATGGEIVFNGTAPQTLGGTTIATFIFQDLTIENPAGIVVSKNIRAEGTVTLTAGLVEIGDNNFIFGDAAVVSGAPSASNMIIATGAGQVQKILSASGSFSFPVGDKDVITEYSPVSLNFMAGTFAAGALAGLNLVNAKHPNPAISGSYINRYWNLSQIGITSFVCDAIFKYEIADVTGTESAINTLRVTPAPLTNFGPANTTLHELSATGLTSFGSFTGGQGTKTVNLKLYFEGLYAGGGTMRKAQGTAGDQYPGTIADVYTVELHDAVNYATIVFTSGNINLNTDGTSQFTLPSTLSGSYWVTVRHRNSIATVSSAPISFASGTINYDFSALASQAFGNNMKNAAGIMLLYGGDIDQDGFVGVSDLGAVDNQSSAFGFGYLAEDADGDGFVGVTDMGLIDNNSSAFVSAITP